jgi:hypothetical protein
MLMRPKHPLVRLQAPNVSGDLMGSFAHHFWRKTNRLVTFRRWASGPVTSFLFLRYRRQGFQVAAEVPHRDRMIIVIS